MPNTSGVDRRCAYFGYRSSGRFWGTERGNPSCARHVSSVLSSVCVQPPIDRLSVRGAGAGGPVAGLSEETLKRLDGEGKLSLQRRRILGLPDEGTGED